MDVDKLAQGKMMLESQPGLTIAPCQVRPESRGSIHIKSADATVYPTIVPNYLAKSLDQTAQTVPKKPLFLRRVLYQAITEDFDGKEVLARVLQAKAVAALGIVEGLSETRLRELGEAFAGGGVMFRSVASLDAGKKSVAIDIVVDVMLLPPEAP